VIADGANTGMPPRHQRGGAAGRDQAAGVGCSNTLFLSGNLPGPTRLGWDGPVPALSSPDRQPPLSRRCQSTTCTGRPASLGGSTALSRPGGHAPRLVRRGEIPAEHRVSEGSTGPQSDHRHLGVEAEVGREAALGRGVVDQHYGPRSLALFAEDCTYTYLNLVISTRLRREGQHACRARPSERRDERDFDTLFAITIPCPQDVPGIPPGLATSYPTRPGTLPHEAGGPVAIGKDEVPARYVERGIERGGVRGLVGAGAGRGGGSGGGDAGTAEACRWRE